MSDASPHSPIVLFTYNRPGHTGRMLETLRQNHLVSESELFVFQDGPREPDNEELLKNMQEVADLIESISWCKRVHFKRREKNLGVDESIMQGVSEVIAERGTVISLEDDLELSPGFLQFMNDALRIYEKDVLVKQVAGYVFPVKKSLPASFLIKGYAESLGWGTWERAWSEFNRDEISLIRDVSKQRNGIKRFNFNNNFDFFGILKTCLNKRDKPWDIRFFASIFLAEGLVLLPGRSLVQNCGLDGTGFHGAVDSRYQHDALADGVHVEPLPIEENAGARTAYEGFLKSLKPSFASRVKGRLLRQLKPHAK